MNSAITVLGLFLTARSVFTLLETSTYDPFGEARYNVTNLTVTPLSNGSPLKSTVYIPTASNGTTFTPIYFIGGLAGYQAAETYSDLLTRVAGQGYIIMGMDRLSLADSGNKGPLMDTRLGSSLDLFIAQTKWLRNYLTTKKISNPNWEKTVLMCHSEGCDVAINMIINVTGIAQAVVYLDPFSINAKLITSVPAKIPAFCYVSALSEIFPACCVKGFGYRRFYELMTCVKVRMDVQGFGHCDLLDHKDWQLCHNVGICQTTNDTRLDEYKNFLQGTVVSFLRWTLDGDDSMKKYVTDPKYISLPLLDLAYNETCVS